MVKIKPIEGTEKDLVCIGCALQSGKAKGLGGVIFETKNFNVSQDYEIPIPCFLVIASKRHIVGFAEFTEEEKLEFIDLLCKVRKGMKEVFKIKYIQILFKEETIESKVNPSHFHIALLPKYSWMKDFSNVLEILTHAKKNLKTKTNLLEVKNIIQKMQKYLSKD